MLSRAWLFALFVFVVAAQANAAADFWVLHGRVLDSEGRPAPEVDIATWWTAHGVPADKVRRVEKENGPQTKSSSDRQRMLPLGEHPTKTDSDGRFSLALSYRIYYLLAIDRQQTQGALFVSASPRSPSVVELRLAPLVRLHGRVRIAGTGQPPDSGAVIVRLPETEKFPLGGNRLVMCKWQSAQFEVLLPPGNYELESGADRSGRRYVLNPYRPVTLPAGIGDVDCGTLELVPPPQNRDDRIRDAREGGLFAVDRSKSYGQAAAKWHAVDARGMPKDAQVSDFKGKWVLAYFWGPYCAPCLGKTLPALTEFYEAHGSQRDRFEIVAVCNAEPETKSMNDLDQFLKPIVKTAWHGKPLPFPVVLDNTLKTAENFGIELIIGQKLLFDPTGRLVPGDEKTLAEKLNR
jgi:thiol-disulfide isomerase/thioredoxin